MKKVTLILTLAVITLSSFKINWKPLITNSSEQMASSIVSALQHSSAQEYAALFPSVEEFQQVMKENAAVYGPYEEEAKHEFALDYERVLLPRVKESFNALILEGQKKGIDWSHVSYVRVEVQETIPFPQFAVPFTIVISAQGKEYKVQIEKALFLNGQWRVSQFIKLV